jgi:hypothetical protein
MEAIRLGFNRIPKPSKPAATPDQTVSARRIHGERVDNSLSELGHFASS